MKKPSVLLVGTKTELRFHVLYHKNQSSAVRLLGELTRADPQPGTLRTAAGPYNNSSQSMSSCQPPELSLSPITGTYWPSHLGIVVCLRPAYISPMSVVWLRFYSASLYLIFEHGVFLGLFAC